MGYGEFGGGGSVRWRVVHGDKAQKGRDRDPLPNHGAGGVFRVYIDGSSTPVAVTSVDTGQVRVVWDPDTKATSDADLEEKKKADPQSAV